MRSTSFLRAYRSRLKLVGLPPVLPRRRRWACWSLRSGIVCRICRRRRYRRFRRELYALSPHRWSGRVRGCPPAGRGTRMRSRTGMSWGASPHCPGVIRTASGRQPPSFARWIFVVSPPRERPIASSSRCQTGARRRPGIRGGRCRAPAACWWTRHTVESTLTTLQSIRPSASASAWRALSTFSRVPSADHLRCLSWQVFHFPNREGRSRHGIPVRCRKRIPLMTMRWFFQRPPRPTFFGRCGSSRSHSPSERSPRPTPSETRHQRDGHATHQTVPRCSRSTRVARNLLTMSLPGPSKRRPVH